jgi:hypothetical protein
LSNKDDYLHKRVNKLRCKYPFDRLAGMQDTCRRETPELSAGFEFPPGGISMTKSRLFQVLAALAIVACFVCGQQALAQEKPHFQVKVLPRQQQVTPDVPDANPAPPANLYGLDQAFTAFALDSNSADAWPCFGNTASPSADCSTILNGGVVVGVPSYVWSFANCDAFTNGTSNTAYVPCGQTETWYEDDSNTGATFDLTYLITATQVQSGVTQYLVDSGTVDFGPNPFGGATPPADVIIYGDQNLGDWPGATVGPNNANCTANINYPTAADPAGVLFIIQANKTCVAPLPGLVSFTAVTTVAKPIYTKHTTVAACGNTPPPCWTVTYSAAGKKSVTQKWNIWLQ